jgi:predicted nucleic acid-binding Zn ribbon protein
MPTYEYRCKNCGAEMTAVQKITDEPHRFIRHENLKPKRHHAGVLGPVERTPRMGEHVCSGEVERLISKSSFVLKGGGWSGSGYSR